MRRLVGFCNTFVYGTAKTEFHCLQLILTSVGTLIVNMLKYSTD